VSDVSAGVTVPVALSHLTSIYEATLFLPSLAGIAASKLYNLWSTAVLDCQRHDKQLRHHLGETAKSELGQGRALLNATRSGDFLL
jgi:hypothetical protein